MTTEQPGRKFQILLVDDHMLIRRGMTALIAQEDDLHICGEAGDLGEAMQLVRRLAPDLVIVDLTLTTGSGLELIKQIAAVRPETKMLVCSMHDEKLYAERCLRAGAHGYINKEAAGAQIVTAIRTILSGQPYVSKSLANQLLTRMIGGQQLVNESPMDALTDRQLEVFQLIGQGLSTREIAEKMHLSHKTIESYREQIKAKLSLKNASELNRHAVQWALEQSSDN